jgi:broad specificity phosphatase PhoE
MPAPQSYYVSPLWRCLETADITFASLDTDLPKDRPYKPLIKEGFRETIGAHTCDRRSRKSELHTRWEEMKGYKFENSFTEEDELWKPRDRETDNATDDRIEEALDEVWKVDKNEWISVTAHSGAISSFLRGMFHSSEARTLKADNIAVIGHRKFGLETGGVIPVIVKTVKAEGKKPVREGDKWMTITMCPKPTEVPPPGGIHDRQL